MNTPEIVSPEQWEAAREELLVKEKEHTRAGDALAAKRRRMPWTAVEKEYAFEGPDGRASLADLFDGRRQLIVYRAFYGPDVTTTVDGTVVSRAGVRRMLDGRRPGRAPRPPERARHDARVRLARAAGGDPGPEERMGWKMPWYTITDEFDADFDVGEWHGHNAFIRDGDRIYRTYFIDARGDEASGQHLELSRHDRARPPGGVGGLAGGLAADGAVRVVELPRRLRGGAA